MRSLDDERFQRATDNSICNMEARLQLLEEAMAVFHRRLQALEQTHASVSNNPVFEERLQFDGSEDEGSLEWEGMPEQK
jgi:hypothetical protein